MVPRAKKCIQCSPADFECGDIPSLPPSPNPIELFCPCNGLFVGSSRRASYPCFRKLVPYISPTYLKPSLPSRAYHVDLLHSRTIIVELARNTPESSSPIFLSSESIHSTTFRTSFSSGSRGRWSVKITRSSSGSFTAIFDEEPWDDELCSFRCVLGWWTKAELGGSSWTRIEVVEVNGLNSGNRFGLAVRCISTITSGKLMEAWARPRLRATSLASREVKVIWLCFENAVWFARTAEMTSAALPIWGEHLVAVPTWHASRIVTASTWSKIIYSNGAKRGFNVKLKQNDRGYAESAKKINSSFWLILPWPA